MGRGGFFTWEVKYLNLSVKISTCYFTSFCGAGRQHSTATLARSRSPPPPSIRIILVVALSTPSASLVSQPPHSIRQRPPSFVSRSTRGRPVSSAVPPCHIITTSPTALVRMSSHTRRIRRQCRQSSPFVRIALQFGRCGSIVPSAGGGGGTCVGVAVSGDGLVSIARGGDYYGRCEVQRVDRRG
jgi:hypothetical protein